jgi:hypothetical protein
MDQILSIHDTEVCISLKNTSNKNKKPSEQNVSERSSHRGWSFLCETFHLLFSQMLNVESYDTTFTSYNFLMRSGKYFASLEENFSSQPVFHWFTDSCSNANRISFAIEISVTNFVILKDEFHVTWYRKR